MLFYLLCSERLPNGTSSASLVLSSQIPGYEGVEMDSGVETVELSFPIKVCKICAKIVLEKTAIIPTAYW